MCGNYLVQLSRNVTKFKLNHKMNFKRISKHNWTENVYVA